MQICLAFILKCEFKYSTLKTTGIYLHAISQHLKIRTKSQCIYVHVCVYVRVSERVNAIKELSFVLKKISLKT